jgi:hypothetical protein
VSTQVVPPEEPGASSRFAFWVYSSLAAFVVLMTLCYVLAGPILNAMEAVVRKLFL